MIGLIRRDLGSVHELIGSHVLLRNMIERKKERNIELEVDSMKNMIKLQLGYDTLLYNVSKLVNISNLHLIITNL